MDTIRLVSWNVNGFRALSGKPDWDWFASTDADVVALQETKAEPAQIAEEHRSPEGWNAEWLAAQVKKGYSGVAVFSRQKAALEPLAVHRELPDPRYQGEGRLLHIESPAFHFFNVYFPNGTKDDGRLAYKMGYYDAFLAHAEELRRTKPIVVCGDFNTAHRPIDLARPKANEENYGQIRELIQQGFPSVKMFTIFNRRRVRGHLPPHPRRRAAPVLVVVLQAARPRQQRRVAHRLLLRFGGVGPGHPGRMDRKQCLWFGSLPRGAGIGHSIARRWRTFRIHMRRAKTCA